MNAVSLKFVDSVVELFSKTTLDLLAPNVAHPHWKPAVDLHHRIQYAFVEDNHETGATIDTRTIRENGRFARIVEVCDRTYDFSANFQWKHYEQLQQGEAPKLMGTVAPLIDQVSAKFYSRSHGFMTMLLSSLLNRVYLNRINIIYCGQITHDFLEDQIDNSPFLNYVEVMGCNWPQCSLSLIKKFCLKERPGKHVTVDLSCKDVVIDTSDIQELLDHWKATGNLNFRLYYHSNINDEEGFQALVSRGETREKNPNEFRSFFLHETEKSIARVSNHNNIVECFTCECDRFEKCHLKEELPEYHYLLKNVHVQHPATCDSCSTTLPLDQFFECSKCFSDLGGPQMLICGACVVGKHVAHISEVRKACLLDAQEVAEAIAHIELPEWSANEEEAKVQELASKVSK
uniref:C2H2-type domain-containing protein n=1 Tax=Steinernema glaseri TaxID=37863 RepID=A0A1I8A116_9BILA